MIDPLTITKDITFWYVIEDVLKSSLPNLSATNRSLVAGCLGEISEAINEHCGVTE